MTTGLTEAARQRAVLGKNKKYDGIFYFGVKTTGLYCRPSCSMTHLFQKNYSFFDTVEKAKLQGYTACKVCHPDRLKNSLSLTILGRIDAGEINDKGVCGLASSLHISERHMRRLVQNRTGTSPFRLNKAKRLRTAKLLITETKLPIIDVAFKSEFSSLRQFNDAFRSTFNISPHEMRRTVSGSISKP